MRARKINRYTTTSSTNQLVDMYVYEIYEATAEELVDFELTQGKYYKTSDRGLPILQSASFEGNDVEVVKGKRKEPKTGILVDAYKPLASEDTEFKRIAYSRVAGPVMSTKSLTPVIPTVSAGTDANNVNL
jgi:hypothetical protein